MKRATTLTTGVLALIALTSCGKSVIPAKAIEDERGNAPTACLDALDRAEDTFDIFTRLLDVLRDALPALAYGDQDQISDSATEIGRLADQIDRDAYDAAAHECRNP